MPEQSRSKNLFDLPPDGTVTFLFTDIEGSTQLLNRLGKQYVALLSKMRRVVRNIIARMEGHEIGTEGDSFFVAFARAKDAVAAAVDIQLSLSNQVWPENITLQLRIGIHTGEPWVDEEGYTGLDVHRAARITDIGHGGQVLLSETTSALVRDDLPSGVSLLDLGLHRLKGLESPENIRQLVIPGLPTQFPPLNSFDKLISEGTATDQEYFEQTLEDADINLDRVNLDDILSIRTFGRLQIQLGTKPISGFTSRKVEALLVYLACINQPVNRHKLADMFWEVRSTTQADSNLKVALTNLEKVLKGFVHSTQNSVQINQQAPIWLDAAIIEKIITEKRVEGILKLYRGDFLDGFQIRSARSFEVWCENERKRLRILIRNVVGENMDSSYF